MSDIYSSIGSISTALDLINSSNLTKEEERRQLNFLRNHLIEMPEDYRRNSLLKLIEDKLKSL